MTDGHYPASPNPEYQEDKNITQVSSPTPSGESSQKKDNPLESSLKKSWWNELLNFLYQGGFKSLIVSSAILGAILITWNNDKICAGLPSSGLPQGVTRTNLPAGTPAGTPAAETRDSNQLVNLVQPNAICSKYFELVFMIVGGYLGLSLPSSNNLSSNNNEAANNNEQSRQNEQ